ncbi:unnamed protein product [Blepharisma stoltei]|uniref:Uncharacterized protein n=1 Tax=Blepharisma stoltei TaxID=1481888 RepID=A0AAU9J6B2_9CILI|nr:unnamed protein product [Blepharisma stoltei]
MSDKKPMFVYFSANQHYDEPEEKEPEYQAPSPKSEKSSFPTKTVLLSSLGSLAFYISAHKAYQYFTYK